MSSLNDRVKSAVASAAKYELVVGKEYRWIYQGAKSVRGDSGPFTSYAFLTGEQEKTTADMSGVWWDTLMRLVGGMLPGDIITFKYLGMAGKRKDFEVLKIERAQGGVIS